MKEININQQCLLPNSNHCFSNYSKVCSFVNPTDTQSPFLVGLSQPVNLLMES